MPYAIIAERHGLTVFNRARTAAEALDLAITWRQSGAEAVFVRDEAWTLIPATELERTAQSDRDAGGGVPESAEMIRVSSGPRNSAGTREPVIDPGRDPRTKMPAREGSPAQRTGRVRVFKAPSSPRPHD